MSWVTTAFHPRQNGFHFDNCFENVVFAGITTRGRCGGMAFGALDYYYARLPIPAHDADHLTGGVLPSEGNSLADYIGRRLNDSLVLNAKKFIRFTLCDDDELVRLTEGEIQKLLHALERGPVPLGLIATSSLTNIASNHQVVAYGVNVDESSAAVTVLIYDPNAHDTAVTLLRARGQSCFTSSVNGIGPTYRGWFVEDYSPVVPPYVDLAVRGEIVLRPARPAVGEAVECTYVVKNYGEFPSTVGACLAVVEHEGEVCDPFDFVPGATLTRDEERRVTVRHDCFAKNRGHYVVGPEYSDRWRRDHMRLPTASESGSTVVFTPRSEVAVDVIALSPLVTAPPPYVSTVNVWLISDDRGQPLKPCEQPRRKYHGTWRNVDARTRVLETESEAIVAAPQKSLRFDVHFSTAGSMLHDSVRLALVGFDESGTFQVKVPLEGSGDFFTGVWKLPPKTAFGGDYNLVIDGADNVPRIPGRRHDGSVIDAVPGDVPSVDTSAPPFEFENYLADSDQNHKIHLTSPYAFLGTDALETNDTFDLAKNVRLPVPSARGAWSRFSNLNFHSADDVDTFLVYYESSPQDDSCSIEEPQTKELSDSFGISISEFPPSLLVSVDGHGCCIDIDLYTLGARGPELVRALRGEPQFLLYNPTKLFADKAFYAVVRNSDFEAQEAFNYDIEFGYSPRHLVVRPTGGHGRTTVQRKILKRIYDKIDLPHPPEDMLSHAVNGAFPYPPGCRMISSREELLERLTALVSDPGILDEIETVRRGAAHEFVMRTVDDLSAFAGKHHIAFDRDALANAIDVRHALVKS